MRDDDSPGPSLLLAGHHRAHREHLLNQHNHNRLHHRRTADATATTSASVVTEVIQTVSVVAQIDVDGNGSTFSVLTVPADATSNGYQAALTDSSSPTTTTAASPLSSNTAPGALSTAGETASKTNSSSLISQSSSPSQSATTASTSTPSTHASFASLIASSNSTTLISSSSSLSHTFTNSSSLSSSRSPLTYLTSSSSSTSSEESSITSISSSNSFTSSFQSTSTGSAGVVAGGTGVTPGTATSSVASPGNGTSPNSGSSVSTSAVVGGVVGSVAGVAIIALLLLFIVKWRKNRNGALLSLGSGRDGAGDGADAVRGGPPSQPSGAMIERRSFVYAVPAALASLTGYKRSSQKTERTISSTAGSERGFYRVSGRKLPSVLQTGGDGYGGGMPDNTLSGSSFYRDSHGFYGGPGTPTFPALETQRESGQIGTPVMRPSPARTPVTEQGPFSAVPPPLDPLPPRSDVLGRSHPSQDGSHASRFTEEV